MKYFTLTRNTSIYFYEVNRNMMLFGLVFLMKYLSFFRAKKEIHLFPWDKQEYDVVLG